MRNQHQRAVGSPRRVLVALEDDYRLYRETIAESLKILRTAAKVESTTLESLEEDLKHFDPQVIICSKDKDAKPDGSLAWIELSLDLTRPAKFSVGAGRSFEVANPSLEDLLKVIDEFA